MSETDVETSVGRILGLLASADVIEFQTAEAYSSLDITNVKYMHIHSRYVKVKIVL
jgi:hypothetical protein